MQHIMHLTDEWFINNETFIYFCLQGCRYPRAYTIYVWQQIPNILMNKVHIYTVCVLYMNYLVAWMLEWYYLSVRPLTWETSPVTQACSGKCGNVVFSKFLLWGERKTKRWIRRAQIRHFGHEKAFPKLTTSEEVSSRELRVDVFSAILRKRNKSSVKIINWLLHCVLKLSYIIKVMLWSLKRSDFVTYSKVALAVSWFST